MAEVIEVNHEIRSNTAVWHTLLQNNL